MPNTSEIILSQTIHPSDSTVSIVTGNKFKGDGYYGRSDGLHTIQYDITGFIGTVSIQGTLATDPVETDWFNVRLGISDEFTIDTTGKISKSTLSSINYTEATTGSFSYNFTGNYIWVRARIEDWTAGTVNSIIFSH